MGVKNKKNVMVNGVEVELQEQEGDELDDTGADLGAEEEGEEEQGDVDSDESATVEEEEAEALELDWKAARDHLKAVDAAVGYSIDDYEQRSAINPIKKRYNDKERTLSLYELIMAL